MNLMTSWQEFMSNSLFESIVRSIIKVVGGLLVVWVLFKTINILSKKLEYRMNKNSKLDATIVNFLKPLISKVLKFFVLICYIGYIGIETSSIAAAITSAGLAIGLALQGSLSNFAGGFIILLMRPFKVGDYIETCNQSGTVESIQVFYTTLITPDNKVIRIPNGEVANSSILDLTSKSLRRVDLIIPIAYEEDFTKAKLIIEESINKMDQFLTKPIKYFINILKHNEKSIEVFVRVWTKTENYWDVYYELLEKIHMNFNKNKIIGPYSKVYVNVINK